MARRAEWQQEVLLASLLDRWIDPATTFATAVDNVTRDATSGAMRRRRGVVPGLPDNLVVHRRKRTGCILVAIEMKSPGGRCSPSQYAAREGLLRAGAEWWECRSAHAAMWALHSCTSRA